MRLRVDRWNALVNSLAMWPGWTMTTRSDLLRRFGVRIGEHTLVQPCLIGSDRVVVGRGCYIGPECHLDGTHDLVIGDRVALAHGVMIVTSSHDHADPELRAGPHRDAPVVIGDGAWLGARVVVLPGVTVGAGCVVAAGSLVSHDCEPHGLYAGVPATRRRDLPTTLPDRSAGTPPPRAG